MSGRDQNSNKPISKPVDNLVATSHRRRGGVSYADLKEAAGLA